MSSWSSKPYRPAVARILNERRPASVLDIASGDGWLAAALDYPAILDAMDLFAAKPAGYRDFYLADINGEFPCGLPVYDAVVCCEAIAYLTNPGRFLDQVGAVLKPGGLLVISSPNPAYVGSRLLFLVRGHFPGFSYFLHNDKRVPHMPWLPFGWPQFWLVLGLHAYGDIEVHPVPEPRPKHFWERLLGWPARMYCRRQRIKSETQEEQRFWERAGSDQVLYGRRLVISALRA